MPPTQRARRATQTNIDDVDEYILDRQARSARRSSSDLRSADLAAVPAASGHLRSVGSDGRLRSEAAARTEGRGRGEGHGRGDIRGRGDSRPRRDLMRADFAWSDPPPRQRDEPAEGVEDEHDVRRHRSAGAGRNDPRAAPDPEVLTRAWDDAIEVPAGAANGHGRALPVAAEMQAYSAVPEVWPPEEASSDARLQTVDHGGRRTIVITGHGADRHLSPGRGYEARLRVHERSGFKPDRMAMWAVLLGLALLLAAATSSHAAVLHAVSAHLR